MEHKTYLTIKEKKELLLAGKDIPLCVYEDTKKEKSRKKELKKSFKSFCKNILN